MGLDRGLAIVEMDGSIKTTSRTPMSASGRNRPGDESNMVCRRHGNYDHAV